MHVAVRVARLRSSSLARARSRAAPPRLYSAFSRGNARSPAPRRPPSALFVLLQPRPASCCAVRCDPSRRCSRSSCTRFARPCLQLPCLCSGRSSAASASPLSAPATPSPAPAAQPLLRLAPGRLRCRPPRARRAPARRPGRPSAPPRRLAPLRRARLPTRPHGRASAAAPRLPPSPAAAPSRPGRLPASDCQPRRLPRRRACPAPASPARPARRAASAIGRLHRTSQLRPPPGRPGRLPAPRSPAAGSRYSAARGRLGRKEMGGPAAAAAKRKKERERKYIYVHAYMHGRLCGRTRGRLHSRVCPVAARLCPANCSGRLPGRSSVRLICCLAGPRPATSPRVGRLRPTPPDDVQLRLSASTFAGWGATRPAGPRRRPAGRGAGPAAPAPPPGPAVRPAGASLERPEARAACRRLPPLRLHKINVSSSPAYFRTTCKHG